MDIIENRKNEITALYERCTVREIAEETGFTANTVYAALVKWGVHIKKKFHKVGVEKKENKVINHLPILPEYPSVPSKAFFPLKEDQHDFDYGTKAFEINEQLKLEREINVMYDTHSFIRYEKKGISETARQQRLSNLSKDIEKLESMLYPQR